MAIENKDNVIEDLLDEMHTILIELLSTSYYREIYRVKYIDVEKSL
ncbi:MAG: hypothetical protein ACOCUI_00735 [bacterium]